MGYKDSGSPVLFASPKDTTQYESQQVLGVPSTIAVYSVDDLTTPGIYVVAPNSAQFSALTGMLLGEWGSHPPVYDPQTGITLYNRFDYNQDGVVNASDLGILLGLWTPNNTTNGFRSVIKYPGSNDSTVESRDTYCIINDWFTYARGQEPTTTASYLPYKVIKQTGYKLENDSFGNNITTGFTASPDEKWVRQGILTRDTLEGTPGATVYW
jgi:hypothetical protein